MFSPDLSNPLFGGSSSQFLQAKRPPSELGSKQQFWSQPLQSPTQSTFMIPNLEPSGSFSNKETTPDIDYNLLDSNNNVSTTSTLPPMLPINNMISDAPSYHALHWNLRFLVADLSIPPPQWINSYYSAVPVTTSSEQSGWHTAFNTTQDTPVPASEESDVYSVFSSTTSATHARVAHCRPGSSSRPSSFLYKSKSCKQYSTTLPSKSAIKPVTAIKAVYWKNQLVRFSYEKDNTSMTLHDLDKVLHALQSIDTQKEEFTTQMLKDSGVAKAMREYPHWNAPEDVSIELKDKLKEIRKTSKRIIKYWREVVLE